MPLEFIYCVYIPLVSGHCCTSLDLELILYVEAGASYFLACYIHYYYTAEGSVVERSPKEQDTFLSQAVVMDLS